MSDQVVITIDGPVDAPRVELTCHGSPVIVRWLIQRLLQGNQVQELTWKQWLRLHAEHRLAGEVDVALADAPTQPMGSLLLIQGQLWQAALERWSHQIQTHPVSVAEELQAILEQQQWGLHILAPWRVVVAGAVNAGKSSLVNALLGYERSIASPWEGTTRDLVTGRTIVQGWPVELIDTAGLRSQVQHEVEAAGIALTEHALTQADAVLWLIDAAQPPWLEPPVLHGNCPLLVLLNKIDLLGDCATLPMLYQPHPRRAVSVASMQGLEGLLETLLAPLLPSQEATRQALAPFTARLQLGVRTVLQLLSEGKPKEAFRTIRSWLEPLPWHQATSVDG